MVRYSLGPVDSAGNRPVLLDGRYIGLLAYEPGEPLEWGLYPSGNAFADHSALPAPITKFWHAFASLDAAKAFLGIEAESAAPALREAA
ncbi:hypothetical protein [Methylobacterium sp. E-045]|uniref:hypothetical protein n=1 Tax=Methylobacterium sp. E-045 TaxID=2836575 RepID=UPI001FB95F15|nr:hypothetical protein [Methylobacterium sp. E-045]MCJ2128339.1 hypothetical protein [Methylobacterium sp. E-045]